jgi:ribosomal protein L40E
MNCTRCGHANPDRARFCLECGVPVKQGCTSCGTELPAGAKFCLECGAAVALGAEEWHRILERFFAILTEGVHRFEGTVNQYTAQGPTVGLAKRMEALASGGSIYLSEQTAARVA